MTCDNTTLGVEIRDGLVRLAIIHKCDEKVLGEVGYGANTALRLQRS